MQTVDLAQVLLDTSPEPKLLGGDDWDAWKRPSAPSLVAGAVRDNLTRPDVLGQTLRSVSASVARTAETSGERAACWAP